MRLTHCQDWKQRSHKGKHGFTFLGKTHFIAIDIMLNR